MKKFLTKVIAYASVLALLLTGCGSADATKQDQKSAAGQTAGQSAQTTAVSVKDSIVIALQGEPAGLDTQFLDDGNARHVTNNIYETLTNLDKATLEPIAGLATEFKNVDANTWEFTLREGVKFHNGEAFTAEDVAYSINRTIDPAFKSSVASWISTIKEVKVIAANKVQIITDGPDPLLTKRLTLLPIFSKSFTEANKANITSLANGTGPYKFVSWSKGSDIQLVRNDDYWGTKPSIKDVKFRFIQEAATRLSALKAGEIDFAFNMYPEYIKDLPKSATITGNESFVLRFNRLRGPLVNNDLALAINYAIDVPSLIKK